MWENPFDKTSGDSLLEESLGDCSCVDAPSLEDNLSADLIGSGIFRPVG